MLLIGLQDHMAIIHLMENHSYRHKHLSVKKATGLEVTEFFLRLMAWLCLRNDDYQNSQMCIVTGPNIDIAIKLIKRMRALFEPKLVVTFDSKETVLELNDCSIEAYPSNHIDAYRALDNPKFILINEGDFFRKSDQEDVRHVSERYIAKSDPYIVFGLLDTGSRSQITLLGSTVNLASRLESIAEKNQILTSTQVKDLIQNEYEILPIQLKKSIQSYPEIDEVYEVKSPLRDLFQASRRIHICHYPIPINLSNIPPFSWIILFASLKYLSKKCATVLGSAIN
jgi:hypothetical protein